MVFQEVKVVTDRVFCRRRNPDIGPAHLEELLTGNFPVLGDKLVLLTVVLYRH